METINNEQIYRKIIDVTNQVSIKLLEVKEERNVYSIVKESIEKIAPGIFFTVTKLQDDDMNFRIIESSGFDNYFKAIKLLIGKDPFTIDFPFNDLDKETIEAFESRKIYHFKGGLNEISNGKLNKFISTAIEKMLGISEVCAMSFYVDKQYFGGITMLIPSSFIKKGYPKQETELAIETIANQAATVIHKLRGSEALIENEKKLIETNLQIELLIDNSTSGYIFEDKSRKIIKVNKAFCNMFYLPEPQNLIELDNKTKLELISNTFTNPESFISGTEILINNNSAAFNQIHSLKDGRIIERDFIPIRNHTLRGYLWQYRDISLRIKYEEELLISQSRFNQLVSQLNDIIWIAKGDRTEIIDLNNSFEKFYGYSANDFNINPNLWTEVVYPEDREIARAAMDELFRTGNSKAEYRIISVEGKIIWLIDHKSIVFDNNGKALQMGGIASDITERKQIEMKLEKQTELLKELNHTKDKFFSIIAHDLKGPFFPILGLIDTLYNNYQELDDESRLKHIDLVSMSAWNVYKLLENLLEWSKLQIGHYKVTQEDINLRKLTAESIELYLQHANAKEITIINNIAEDIVIHADIYSIKTVIRNLFINAVKYTHQKGDIEFNAKRKNNQIEISIKDSGVGMSQERIDNLFKVEKSLSTPGTNNELGTGLGLIICKDIIKLNNGKIDVESELGNGTTFRISIPSV